MSFEKFFIEKIKDDLFGINRQGGRLNEDKAKLYGLIQKNMPVWNLSLANYLCIICDSPILNSYEDHAFRAWELSQRDEKAVRSILVSYSASSVVDLWGLAEDSLRRETGVHGRNSRTKELSDETERLCAAHRDAYSRQCAEEVAGDHLSVARQMEAFHKAIASTLIAQPYRFKIFTGSWPNQDDIAQARSLIVRISKNTKLLER